jgi:hypothetical protein
VARAEGKVALGIANLPFPFPSSSLITVTQILVTI